MEEIGGKGHILWQPSGLYVYFLVDVDVMLQAPEVLFQQQSSGTYNHKADYWSFGTLVFECITGRRPFFHSNDTDKW